MLLKLYLPMARIVIALTGKIHALSTRQRILATVALPGIVRTLLGTAE